MLHSRSRARAEPLEKDASAAHVAPAPPAEIVLSQIGPRRHCTQLHVCLYFPLSVFPTHPCSSLPPTHPTPLLPQSLLRSTPSTFTPCHLNLTQVRLTPLLHFLSGQRQPLTTPTYFGFGVRSPYLLSGPGSLTDSYAWQHIITSRISRWQGSRASPFPLRGHGKGASMLAQGGGFGISRRALEMVGGTGLEVFHLAIQQFTSSVHKRNDSTGSRGAPRRGMERGSLFSRTRGGVFEDEAVGVAMHGLGIPLTHCPCIYADAPCSLSYESSFPSLGSCQAPPCARVLPRCRPLPPTTVGRPAVATGDLCRLPLIVHNIKSALELRRWWDFLQEREPTHLEALGLLEAYSHGARPRHSEQVPLLSSTSSPPLRCWAATSGTDVIALILSDDSHSERQRAVEESWLSVLRSRCAVRAFFVVGGYTHGHPESAGEVCSDLAGLRVHPASACCPPPKPDSGIPLYGTLCIIPHRHAASLHCGLSQCVRPRHPPPPSDYAARVQVSRPPPPGCASLGYPAAARVHIPTQDR